MADTQNFFPKLYGYTPDSKKETKEGNRLDKYNPHEFRLGMAHELIELGCSRLAESTPEERQKATEKILKNLEEHNGYYTALITYNSLYENIPEGKKKLSFKKWLDEQEDRRMKSVIDDEFNKIKDAGHKNDKMEEPKYDKKQYTVPYKTAKLQEAIKKEIRSVLLEKKKKDKEEEGEKEPKDKDLKSIEKEMGRFEAEIFALEKLLFNGKDGDREDEYSKSNPAEGTFLKVKEKLFDTYKSEKQTGEQYREANEEALKTFEEDLNKHVNEFGKDGKGNKVTIGDLLKGPTTRKDGKTQTGFNATINAIEQRIKDIEKEKGEEAAQIKNEKMEVAYQDMTREQHINLLEICKRHGVNLREGAAGIKMYYDIAKEAYIEGLTQGLRL